MIWFSAESALMSIRPSASGPIAIPTTRNTATSGILIFCASRPVRVPIARIRPHESKVCLAISMEADVSNSFSLGATQITGAHAVFADHHLQTRRCPTRREMARSPPTPGRDDNMNFMLRRGRCVRFVHYLVAGVFTAGFGFATTAHAQIVALGASNVAGGGVSGSEAFPAQLERMLAAKGYNVHV